MAELLHRLQALRPTVREIIRVSGTTGVSIGIIHDAKVLVTDNFGFRETPTDKTSGKEPDENTIYYLASLSKSFTAAAIAILVEQGKFAWNTPVSHLHKELQHRDPEIRENASILDFLSHRTGLAPKNHLWSQEFGHMSLRRGEEIRTVTYLEKIADFRSRWIYNNWGYGVADFLVDELTNYTWGEFLKTHIFDPLGMHRTVTRRVQGLDNVARGYMVLSNGQPYPVPEPEGSDGEIIEGALAVKSSVKDLLTYYMAFLRALKAAEQQEKATTHESPFVDAGIMIQPHIKLSTESPDFDGSYGLGWVNARLPCTLGAIGMNHAFLDRMPVVGRGIQSATTCLYHQGSANSFLSSVYLLPESQSGVVVLTNSMSKNDAADWLGELYLEEILDSPQRNNYVRLANNSAKAAMELWPAMAKELAAQQVPNTPVRPYSTYVGKYYNIIGNYHLDISIENDNLVLHFQRDKLFGYILKHYHYDTFSWLLTHDQDVYVGRFPITRASYYLLHFNSKGDDPRRIDSVIWAHDDAVPEGETFIKREGQISDALKVIRAESVAVPLSVTTFTNVASQVQDEVVIFPPGENESKQEVSGEVGVLLETELEELRNGVHDGIEKLEVAGPLDIPLPPVA